MRIQIASDLHHESAGNATAAHPLPLAAGAEMLILAGDIHTGTAAIDLYGDYPVPVIYIHGNHEAYGHAYPGILSLLATRARGTSVRFLQNTEWMVGKVRVLGTCMWTEYALYPCHRHEAIETARFTLTDFRLIRRSLDGQLLQPENVSEYHREAVRWLERKLAEPFDGKTVVISHHAPSVKSLPTSHRNHRLAAAYAASLEVLVSQADLWVHGHLHSSADYQIGKCRVICNPRGRTGKNRRDTSIAYENATFNRALVIDL
ncbi:metallophosphoesterase [Paraburkholderia caribensis]|nr:metallophosphoesterase [Paraburkholderia caribensis]